MSKNKNKGIFNLEGRKNGVRIMYDLPMNRRRKKKVLLRKGHRGKGGR